MSAKKGIIPVSDARTLAKKRQTPALIIFAIEPGGERFTVTTYGANRQLCKHAASLGEQFSAAILDGTVAPLPEEPTDLPDVPTVWQGMKR